MKVITYPLALAAISLLTATIVSASAPGVSMGSDGKLSYTTDSQGNRIADFSYAGYDGGGVALPTVPVKVTISAVSGDNTSHIQSAINQVAALTPDANGVRGALLLNAGTYEVDGVLTLGASGVVIRGAGNSTSGTVLHFVGTTRNSFTVAGAAPATTGTAVTITDSYVPLNAKSFHVSSASGLAVGNLVIVQRPVTQTWINALGMNNIDGSGKSWSPSPGLLFERTITAISGTLITVDIPICNPIESQYTTGEVTHYSDSGRIHGVGIENLRARADYTDFPANILTGYFLSLDNIKNSWISDVVMDHWGNGIVLGKGAKWITVQDCDYIDPATTTVDQAPAAYATSGQMTLFHRCTSDGGYYHIFATQSATAGPNVFLNIAASGTHYNGGPHQHWAAGVLCDNLIMAPDPADYLQIANRGTDGSGQGWAAGFSIAYNCQTTDFQVEQPSGVTFTYNWVIGGIGGEHSFSDEGTYQNLGTVVNPQSLYLQQLLERLGPAALTNIGYGASVPAAAPSFSPAGGTYASTQTVSISSATSGAFISYTTDGSTPTSTSGTVYSGPVTISSTTTLNAIAYESGFTDSPASSATYTINLPQAAAPSFSPAAGIYTSAQTVSISSATSGVSIRYTTDGSAPTEASGTIYSGPVSISSTTTLQAIAYETGFTASDVTSAAYTINTGGGPIVLEAEDLSPVGTGATVSISDDAKASGGIVEFLNSTAVGQSMTLTTPSIPAGTYQVQLRYKTNTTHGQHTVTIDDTQVGGTVDQYATTVGYVTVTLGNATLGTGIHTIVLTVTGQNPAATGFLITADSFTFTPVQPQAAAPAFSPDGGTYSVAQNVTISSATSGASIHFTTDGSTPSETAGAIYSGPVNISSTKTLKAIASKSGLTDSPVTSATYTISVTPPPTLNFEAEGLTYTPNGATASVQTDTNSSGGKWVELAGNSVGDYINFAIPSVAAGTYQLKMEWKGNTTRGILQLSVDGTNLGGTLDQYSAAESYPTTTFGNVTFGSAGTHTIRLTVTGKSSASSSYQLSADKFTLVGQ
jgi:hypothetical protein